ncbi:MAG TPA: heavy metal translocating P-type ATPase, partial [Dehalococcoidia bacterium]|nr:heavy metal translocating P-type ATPase [Dehalococcoidia bacterium]
MRETTLPVAGMSCAACVNKVEKALKGLPGVQQARVNLAAGSAGLVYDPRLLTFEEMERAVQEIGYEVPWDRITLLVTGTAGPDSQQAIAKALEDLGGVVRVQGRAIPLRGSPGPGGLGKKVDVGAGIVAREGPEARAGWVGVEYAEAVVSAGQIKKALRELGYQVSEKGEGEASLDRERQARRAEVRRQLINMLIAWSLGAIVMLGTFRDYWILPRILPPLLGNKLFLFALTTPIVLGPGRQFFVNSWNGLRRGVTDMNLLYATGIGAAYLIAVINTFWPEAGFGGEKATFYEAAALLTAFIILGRYLEALTRGRTSEA